jgi:hypothetical protein
MEGMQYILLALVYFGHYFLGIIDYWGSSHVAGSREQKGLDGMQNLIITLFAQRIL